MPSSHPTQGRSRGGARRLLFRITCASALGTMVLGATSGPAMAAPFSSVEAPLVSAAFSGLRVGSQGTNVKSLQEALLKAGVQLRGGADGVFGPATRQAVVDFQNSRKLAATGEVDQATSAALAAGAGGSSAPAPAAGSTLSVGARGAEVKRVQELLIAAGVYVAGGADGVYGEATKRAVTQFQAWNGLARNGTVDQATSKRLGVTGAPVAPTPPKPSTIAPTPPSTNPYVGLGRGARGALAKDLQTALQRAGITVRGGADGIFGVATETALKAFQRANALPESGVVNERAAAVLKLGTTAPPPAPAPKPAPKPAPAPAPNAYLGLKVGARGQAVKDVQTALIAAGVTIRGGADGVFGNATKSALTNYQTAVGVTADGTVNQASIDKLALGSGRAPTPLPKTDTAPAAPPAGSTNRYVGLAVGSSGSLVRELQTAIQRTGLVVRGGVDGIFGNATKVALVAFQSSNGFPQTGVVSESDARILGLGSVSVANPNSGSFKMERFPVQGRCFFGDTWHAPRGGGRLHVGADVIANQGNLLYAVVSGEISKLYWDQPGALAGNGLRVEEPNGTYYTYLHMASFAPGIELGTKVEAGDVIGFVGNTGASATPHLHFEIHPGGGAAVNPFPALKAIDGCGDTRPQYQSSFE